ncbi:aldehyde dehydrogenase family 7 member A1-like isoform X1 [Dioscorea cayenensis subsp. rotundata]|uniref:aldehyde dehydrogenase (NAD(+)) n=1 Tax=Dioscorea cayennensis subsp. rotundata TaxID=55577 RepID=A0AB40CAP3_DIOCR|nr:aldehyde dehydrogenase family 7 member A1-like isoform X1 [Dioscorea cayenensis subsp. rotundata]XP_039136433.1 aldehyde dehydrogenase family 7 member A1-like isoform X1 [Dioscorea cayenensis subsp. rotundata]XP_039136434.1 aldehyde dehydrogenase family 7 member A1-like isoform X1 [Dioscorea cayenensis subsp. rotundata]
MTEIIAGVLEKNNLHGAIFTSFCGGAEMGQAIACDRWIPLVSFTGSSKVGQMVQQIGNEQFGKCLVELSGNNAIIVMDDANIQLSLLHESIYQTVFDQLIGVYKQVKIGDHLEKKTLKESIEINNSVPQGLSCSIFTRKPEIIFKWIGPLGSDCTIVNVNIPTNGAKIGGAFGGEKATGSGREAESDSWK